jgi:kinetochore protein Spc25
MTQRSTLCDGRTRNTTKRRRDDDVHTMRRHGGTTTMDHHRNARTTTTNAPSNASLLDVDSLQTELDEFKEIITAWVEENVHRERRLRDAHETQLRRFEREYEGLIERERNLSAKAAENQAEAERFELEAEQALEETNAAKELAEGLPEQLSLLRERVRLEKMSLDQAAAKTKGSSALSKLEALRHAARTYSERLGLKFEYGAEEKLRLVFKYIDANAPEREFAFAVRLRDAMYEVVECEPALREMDGLLRECNRSNDFGAFVRGVRKAFVAHAERGGGDFAGARAGGGASPSRGGTTTGRVLRSARR